MSSSRTTRSSFEAPEPVDEHVYLRRDLRRLHSEHRSRNGPRRGARVRDEASVERPLQPRWKPNKQQLRIMTEWYENSGPPTQDQFADIAAQVRVHGEVQDSKIYYWFQNRRSRDRRRRLILQQQQQAPRTSEGVVAAPAPAPAAAAASATAVMPKPVQYELAQVGGAHRASAAQSHMSKMMESSWMELPIFTGRVPGAVAHQVSQEGIDIFESGSAVQHHLSAAEASCSASKGISGCQTLAALGHENEAGLIPGVTVFDSNSETESGAFVTGGNSYNLDVPYSFVVPKQESSSSWGSHPWL